MLIARLEVCPECGYSLHALPARHCCPECGFEYDEFTRVWKPDSPRRIYWITFGGLAGLASPPQVLRSVFVVMHGGALSWPEWIVLIVGVPVVLFTIMYLLLYHTANKQGRYVAITPHGLRYRDVGASTSIAWKDILIEPGTSMRGAYVRCCGVMKDALPKGILCDPYCIGSA